MLALRNQHKLVYEMLCFTKSALQRFLSHALISHTYAYAIRGRPTLNDVERFRNGPVHGLSSLKASQMCKVYTSSYEITTMAHKGLAAKKKKRCKQKTIAANKKVNAANKKVITANKKVNAANKK